MLNTYHRAKMADGSGHGEGFNTTLEKFRKFYVDHVTQDELLEGYGKWADKYDKEYDILCHRSPAILREVVEGLYPAEERPRLTLLDVATGTGRVAQQMSDLGYVIIDGLDGSAGMVEVARKKNIFRNLFLKQITGEPLDIPAESYDVVTCGAGFAKNHLPGEAMHEFVRLVKPGGHIATVSSEGPWNKEPEFHGTLATIIRAYKKDGTLKIKRWEVQEGYIIGTYNTNAVVILLQKLCNVA